MEGRLVLCVDDLEVHLQVRKMYLETKGSYRVLVACDPQSALQIFAENEIDVAVIDYHLKGPVDGAQLAQDMRALRPKTILIMLTGDPNLPKSARDSVDAVFIKGEDGSLAETIKKLLGN